MIRGARQLSQRGFTLLEVIVAIVIAALCLGALAQAFAGGARAAGSSSDYTRAVTLAQSLLGKAGVERALTEGVESGTSSDGRYGWTLTVSNESTTEDGNPVRPPMELKRLVVRVNVLDEDDARAGRSRAVELTTLMAVPRALP
ncbi:MAG: prepilin-type N-terminal cleavage/methylation domain-containing protein [Burkholderiales bacterium]|nr:prepilin-type N-terminal cleavage/methylation domain-containing protein [Burkholderiales bacterium]